MYLKNLHLLNFKNYHSLELNFSDGINCFVGNNGEGKTNLLDGIYYLSMCKSYFNFADSQNIRHGEQFFLVKGTFNYKDADEEIYCGFKLTQGKVFKRNQKEYSRLSDHIGLLPCVIIAPTDINLVGQGSEERRRFIDSIISQFDITYLDNLINYNKAISHRNAVLKKLAQTRNLEAGEMEIWDELIISLGVHIYESRKEFLQAFVPLFNKYYQLLSGGKEIVGIEYDSHLNDADFKQLLATAFEKDKALQYTSVGIHKDDLVFSINNFPLKKQGSQGQQKTFLIALKLAQFEYIKNKKNLKPLLLLDDIFDKLDQSRVEKLMTLVSEDAFGQIFVTDTHPERIVSIFKQINVPVKTFLVKDGEAKMEA
jgi:DNA replication and repair protein RecF